MARARVVVSDTSSEEVDQLRRTVNTLLHMIESAEASLTAGATAENVLDAWADAVRTGKDDNPDGVSDVSPTNRVVVGLRPTPTHPTRRSMAVEEMDASADY